MSDATSWTFASEQKTSETQWTHHAVSTADHARGWTVLGGYRRCTEFDARDHAGQDYCVARCDARHLVAVVADGVGQSFRGDIAAMGVGNTLLQALWEHRERVLSARAVSDALESVRAQIHERVVTTPLSEGIASIVREVLDEKRAKIGSQAVFAAVVLDLERRAGSAYLLGDVDVLVVHPDGRAAVLRPDPQGRWSSLEGFRSPLQLLSIDDVVSVTVKSDGIGATWGTDLERMLDRDAFVAQAEESAARDDVSFIGAVLQSPGVLLPAVQVEQPTETAPSPTAIGAAEGLAQQPALMSIPTRVGDPWAQGGELGAAVGALLTAPGSDATIPKTVAVAAPDVERAPTAQSSIPRVAEYAPVASAPDRARGFRRWRYHIALFAVLAVVATIAMVVAAGSTSGEESNSRGQNASDSRRANGTAPAERPRPAASQQAEEPTKGPHADASRATHEASPPASAVHSQPTPPPPQTPPAQTDPSDSRGHAPLVPSPTQVSGSDGGTLTNQQRRRGRRVRSPPLGLGVQPPALPTLRGAPEPHDNAGVDDGS